MDKQTFVATLQDLGQDWWRVGPQVLLSRVSVAPGASLPPVSLQDMDEPEALLDALQEALRVVQPSLQAGFRGVTEAVATAADPAAVAALPARLDDLGRHFERLLAARDDPVAAWLAFKMLHLRMVAALTQLGRDPQAPSADSAAASGAGSPAQRGSKAASPMLGRSRRTSAAGSEGGAPPGRAGPRPVSDAALEFSARAASAAPSAVLFSSEQRRTSVDALLQVRRDRTSGNATPAAAGTPGPWSKAATPQRTPGAVTPSGPGAATPQRRPSLPGTSPVPGASPAAGGAGGGLGAAVSPSTSLRASPVPPGLPQYRVSAASPVAANSLPPAEASLAFGLGSGSMACVGAASAADATETSSSPPTGS